MIIILAVVLSISILLYSEVKVIRNIGNSMVAFMLPTAELKKFYIMTGRLNQLGWTSMETIKLRQEVCARCLASLILTVQFLLIIVTTTIVLIPIQVFIVMGRLSLLRLTRMAASRRNVIIAGFLSTLNLIATAAIILCYGNHFYWFWN